MVEKKTVISVTKWVLIRGTTVLTMNLNLDWNNGETQATKIATQQRKIRADQKCSQKNRSIKKYKLLEQKTKPQKSSLKKSRKN